MTPVRFLRARIASAMSAVISAADEEAVKSLCGELFALLPRHDRSYHRPWWRRTGKSYPSNGARERSRRMAHIAAGRITAANGLRPA